MLTIDIMLPLKMCFIFQLLCNTSVYIILPVTLRYNILIIYWFIIFLLSTIFFILGALNLEMRKCIFARHLVLCWIENEMFFSHLPVHTTVLKAKCSLSHLHLTSKKNFPSSPLSDVVVVCLCLTKCVYSFIIIFNHILQMHK